MEPNLPIKENTESIPSPISPIPQHPTYQDVWLVRIEYIIILLISTGVIFTLVFLIGHIWFGLFEPTLWNLCNTLSKIKEYWQVGLVVLLPLFFRPTRNFLEKVVKLGGAECQPSQNAGNFPDYNKTKAGT